VLYRSERTIVSRLPDGVVRKELLGPDALARQRQEVSMLEHLATVEGVPKLVSSGPGAEFLVRDEGGAPLSGGAAAREPGTWEPGALADLARQVARILAGVHRRGVLHLDIAPANILHGCADGRPRLVDFHLATLTAEERRGFVPHSVIAGTLAYIAPELTGRVGLPVDHRADLYALGATLYELATGAQPFGHGDALALIRDHIATVPVPPLQRAPALPPALSDIIMRLLEKAPDRRYQSAEGLADDLDRLHTMLAAGEVAPFPLGGSDFPLTLVAPSRLIGREAEIDVLQAAFESAQAGACRGLLVSGAAGVGKTALINQLRPIVTARGGWFLTGTCDPAEDVTPGAMRQVVQGMLALLLAEPESVVEGVRAALAARLGSESGALLAVTPDIAALIGDAAAPDDVTETRMLTAAQVVMEAIVSPARPVVLVLDHVQWATETILSRFGAVLGAEALNGLLLVGIFREEEPGEGHRFTEARRRWAQGGAAPHPLELRNLPPAALTEMIADMLRLPVDAAAPLAEAVGARTQGNPRATVELLNGLRRAKILHRGPDGWGWDPDEIRRHLGDGEVTDLLRPRITALPEAARDRLASMACLGCDVATPLLAAACGIGIESLLQDIAPAVEDGLLLVEAAGGDAAGLLRFADERVQQAVYGCMGAGAPQAWHLSLARRLAPLAAHAVAAAEQYRQAVAAIHDPAEAQVACALFATAAADAAGRLRPGAAELFHAAAISLLEAQTDCDGPALARLRLARLNALYALGRYEELDDLAAVIDGSDADLTILAEACSLRVVSLSNRGRHPEAVPVGLAMLGRLGLQRPSEGLAERSAAELAGLLTWVSEDAAVPDAERRETNDPLIRVTARLISRLLPTAQLLDPPTGAWLALESQRLWARHGACPELVANLARSASSPILFAEDYRTGYAMAQHAMAVGVALGYEAEAAFARQNFATFALHWFERLENTQLVLAQARDGLVRAGEIQAVCVNDLTLLYALLDCAPTLEASVAEAGAARDFAERSGHAHMADIFAGHQRMLLVLTGEADASDYLAETPDWAEDGRPLTLFGFYWTHALLAALFDDPARLAHFSAGAVRLIPRLAGVYRSAVANLLRALSLARQARTGDPSVPGILPAEFHALRQWFAGRAADAPCNFEHLLHLIDAEGAWTEGQFQAAALAFDRAIHCTTVRTRPWHFALIAQSAGLFNLAHGLQYLGRSLLRDAQLRYAAWGATGVVQRLHAAHGFLPAIEPGRTAASDSQSVSLSSDSIDLLAILRASQALSSQTSVGGLQAQLVEVLAAMTGATAVLLVVWDDTRGWCLAPNGEPVAEAAARGALPLSAFRTVERTRAPLVVDDAMLDDRFARDPYFAGAQCCSLLVLPVHSQGSARAVLMLENRLSSGVFSHARLNLVTLVASQLAVSLDNAQLYASLERRVAERTEALAAANRRLELLSISDSLTGLANRRHFDDVLSREWSRARRARGGIGLLMVDIDYFKRYNDHYGHLGGDQCLRTIATTLQNSARRDVDTAARYGGEEFAIILPGVDMDTASLVAHRLHANVRGLREPHSASPFGIITVSIGVAAHLPADDTSAQELVQMADAALYRAKQVGRNRIAYAPAKSLVLAAARR